MNQDPKDSIWAVMYESLEHGSSVHFSVTRTGITNELLVTIHPGKHGENEAWFPPMIFKAQIEMLDKELAKNIRESKFQEAMDIFQNRDVYNAAVDSLGMISRALHQAYKTPVKSIKPKKLRLMADAAYREKSYEMAMKLYQEVQRVSPSDAIAAKIAACAGFITKVNYEDRMQNASSPFAKSSFGKTPNDG